MSCAVQPNARRRQCRQDGSRNVRRQGSGVKRRRRRPDGRRCNAGHSPREPPAFATRAPRAPAPSAASNDAGCRRRALSTDTQSTTLLLRHLRLELVQALGLLVVPADHCVRLLVGLRHFGRPAPSPGRGRAARPCLRTRSSSTRPSTTRSSACGRNMSVVSFMSSAFIPCCCRFCAIRCIIAVASMSTSDEGTAKSALARRPFSTCSLTAPSILRFSSSFRFCGSRRAGRRRCRGDAEAVRERLVERRQRRFADLLGGQHERRGAPGDFLAVVVGRERQRKRLAPARLHAGERGLELGQHPAFAERDGEVAWPGRRRTRRRRSCR